MTIYHTLKPFQGPLLDGRRLGGLGRRRGRLGGRRKRATPATDPATLPTLPSATVRPVDRVRPARRRQRARRRRRRPTPGPTATAPARVDGCHQPRPPRKLAVILQQQAASLLVEGGLGERFDEQAAHDDQDVAQAEVGLGKAKGGREKWE